jgi:integrase
MSAPRKQKMRGGIWLHGRVFWCQFRAMARHTCPSKGKHRHPVPCPDADKMELRTIRENTKKTNADEAREYLAARVVARGNGSLNTGARHVTFENLVMMLEADYAAKQNRSAPYISKALRDRFAGWLAVDITTDVVRAYEAERLKVVSRATVNAELAALRRAFNLAIEAGRLVTKPVIKTPDPKNARQGFVTEKALKAVLAELPEWARGPVLFMSFTGWRVRSEVLRLTWKHNVDWHDKALRLEPGTTKNSEGREFPFAGYPALKALLETQLAIGERYSSPTVFFRSIEGTARPIDYKEMRKSWRAACRAARHPKLIMHDLRRTVVRNLERASVSRSVAMSLTGHRTAAVYSRYAIVDSAAQAEGVAKLAKKLEAVTAQ